MYAPPSIVESIHLLNALAHTLSLCVQTAPQKELRSWLGLEPVPVGVRRRLSDGRRFLGDAIHRHFFVTGSSALALVGEAGTGKSTALANYIHRYRAQYGSVVFINAENAIVLSRSFQRVASGLGLEWASVLKRHAGKAPEAALEILGEVSQCVRGTWVHGMECCVVAGYACVYIVKVSAITRVCI